jgi:hypothetical protein
LGSIRTMISMIQILAFLPLVSAVAFNSNGLSKRAQVCGTHGYDNESPDAYFVQKGSSLASLSACGAHCLADSQCLSFAIGDSTCYHYKKAV